MSSDDELEAIKHKKLAELQKEAATKAMMSSISEPIVLTDSNFASEVTKYPIMLVDFWAPWCGPCRMVSPIIEQLSREYSGRVAFGKVNIWHTEYSHPDGIQGQQGSRRNHRCYAKRTDRDEAKTATIVK
jgi:thiol-disulfide isomerase/thioredoxin